MMGCLFVWIEKKRYNISMILRIVWCASLYM